MPSGRQNSIDMGMGAADKTKLRKELCMEMQELQNFVPVKKICHQDLKDLNKVGIGTFEYLDALLMERSK